MSLCRGTPTPHGKRHHATPAAATATATATAEAEEECGGRSANAEYEPFPVLGKQNAAGSIKEIAAECDCAHADSDRAAAQLAPPSTRTGPHDTLSPGSQHGALWRKEGGREAWFLPFWGRLVLGAAIAHTHTHTHTHTPSHTITHTHTLTHHHTPSHTIIHTHHHTYHHTHTPYTHTHTHHHAFHHP